MLNASHSRVQHGLRDAALIALSFLALPLDTLILLCVYALNLWSRSDVELRRDARRQNASFKPKNILVTGVGMTKGLSLARLFYEAGHNVTGADFEPQGALVCGRVSKSIKRFYKLERPNASAGSARYIEGLLEIVGREKIDLWVSCSGVASAVEDGEAQQVIEARTACRAIQFDVATTQMLHEKHTFIARAKKIGLTVPDTHTITSHDAVESALKDAPKGRSYIMKPIGMDDSTRGDMTLLPKATKAQTTQHLAKLRISEKAPWILQQYIDGPEYCTHALVIRGQVKAFVACPSAELLMHYEALPPSSKLSQAMLDFTTTFADKHGENFTGHLSFDFMVNKSEASSTKKPILYPIECNPRAHTAVVLFTGTPELASTYLSLLSPESLSKIPGPENQEALTPHQPHAYFWLGHDLVEFLLLPLLNLLTGNTKPRPSLISSAKTFFVHLFYWRDGTFELWDPLPWWWLYHVYWPVMFWNALRAGKKWSRVNVSTTKMFQC